MVYLFIFNFFILWLSLWWETVMGILPQVGCRHLLGARGSRGPQWTSPHLPGAPVALDSWGPTRGGPSAEATLLCTRLFPRPAHLRLLHQCLPGPSAVKWVLPFFNSLVRPGFYNLSYNNLFIFPHCLKELATGQTQPLFIKHFEVGRLMFLHSLELYFVYACMCVDTHPCLYVHTHRTLEEQQNQNYQDKLDKVFSWSRRLLEISWRFQNRVKCIHVREISFKRAICLSHRTSEKKVEYALYHELCVKSPVNYIHVTFHRCVWKKPWNFWSMYIV